MYWSSVSRLDFYGICWQLFVVKLICKDMTRVINQALNELLKTIH